MKTLVTGATGYVGIPLTLALANQGVAVKAMFRSEAKTAELLKHPQIELVKGELSDIRSLRNIVKGCDEIFHVAAFAGIWSKDPSYYYRTNVQGTANLLSVAVEEGVKKIVITSTAGVMGPSMKPEIMVNENITDRPLLFSKYDQSKFEQEEKAFSFLEKGIEIVIVNPSRIYGPGIMAQSNAVSHLVNLFNQGKWHFIPGNGTSHGNYVYIDDVVQGHLLAMKKGVSGQRYILGGENMSYNDFFKLLKRLTGRNKRLFKIPVTLLLVWSYLEIFLARSTGKRPMMIPAFVYKLTHNWNLSSDKAKQELGYSFIDLETGLKKTIHWIES